MSFFGVMPFRRFQAARRRSYAKRRTTKRAKASTRRTAMTYKKVARIARGVVAKNAELKSNNAYNKGEVVALFPVVDPPTISYKVFKLTDQVLSLQQGVDNGQRMGNNINMRSLWLRWNLCFSSISVDPNNSEQEGNIANTMSAPYLVRMIIFRVRANLEPPSDTTPDGYSKLPGLFLEGPLSSNPDGTNADVLRIFNKEKYLICYTRTLKIGPANVNPGGSQVPGPVVGDQPGSGTFIAANMQPQYFNNDFKTQYGGTLDLNKLASTPRIVRYDTGEGEPSTPTNLALYCVFLPVLADGSMNLTSSITTGPNAINIPITFSYTTTVYYTD